MSWVPRLLLLLLLLTASLSFAQQTTVTVRLPELLMLELAETRGTTLEQALSVTVNQGSYSFSPKMSSLRILSTGSWQLMMSVQTTSLERIRLLAKLEETARSFPLANYPQTVLNGGSTAGWRTVKVHYSLANPLPPEGSYVLKVNYSLVRP